MLTNTKINYINQKLEHSSSSGVLFYTVGRLAAKKHRLVILAKYRSLRETARCILYIFSEKIQHHQGEP